ncbi:MAG: multiubiquitin domain-containing protein [Actinomycetota bacterium]|nr:multiubiquitin domain-containing protein [Actinomycetota bacterium]MDP1877501.1 multiubiquitin domain-containing protein [Actinomycetota bacterium]
MSNQGKPPVTIFVNTREFQWPEKQISYEQIYNLAFPNEPVNDGDVARIEYSRGHNGGGGGTLHPGESVNVKENMVFDAYVTVRS